MSTRGRRRFVAMGSMVAALGAAAAASLAEEPPEVVDAVHVVRPGDTLEGVTRSFLGLPDDWRANWRRNPFVVDPDLLQPGWRLSILLRPATARPAAQVRQIARSVEAQPAPQPWGRAEPGLMLLERDGVRTFAGSSAELAFTDGSRLLVTENSLLFLRMPRRQEVPARLRAIELVEGQADVELHAARGRTASVEVVLGAARATLTPKADETGQSRSRRLAGGSAQVMLFRGEGAVEAAGQRVELAAGSGTSVPASGPPAPREELLAAPRLLRPAPGEAVEPAQLEVAWEPVVGAADYTAELCRDVDCGQLVERATGLADATWRPATRPEPGDYFWRATARSGSGLDGFPAPASPLPVLAQVVRDRQPPTGSLALVAPQVRVGERVFVLPDAEVRLTAIDAEGPVARWERRVHGQLVDEAGFGPPRADGDYVLTAAAFDGAGNRAELGPLAFTVDGTPPSLDGARAEVSAGGESTRRWLAEEVWSAERGRWTTWRWLDRDRDVRGTLPRLAWRLEEGPPAVVFSADEPLRVEGDLVLDLAKGQELWVAANDAGCGLATMRVRPRRGTGGVALRVEIMAADRLGNERLLKFLVRRP